MAKNYNWRIKREYYNLINKGSKTLEVKVGYPDMLDNEDSSEAIPGVTKYGTLEMYQAIYPKKRKGWDVMCLNSENKQVI